MSGTVAIERSKDVVSFPLGDDSQPTRGAQPSVQPQGKDIDLYYRLKSLERQLEFLEIQVRGRCEVPRPIRNMSL